MAAKQSAEPLRYLTKTLVKTALKCPRRLVFATNPRRYPRATPDPLLRHLAREGQRFGEYCKQLFPHGTEVGVAAAPHDATEPSLSLEDLVAQTRRTLMGDQQQPNNGNMRIAVFEGAIRHGSFCVRPDIVDRTIKSGQSNKIELRVIEVKSKSWDSRDTVESKMWTAKKKSIKAAFQPYIQDIAFQTMVCRAAYPDAHVSSWLMLPDKAKKMKCHARLGSTESPTVDDNMRIIGGGIAALLNVDELVERTLTAEVAFPGSRKGEVLKDVVQRWAEEINNENSPSFDTFASTPIGTQCASCEYRPKNHAQVSGLDVCWQHATGVKVEEPLVVDLYRKTKPLLTTFLSKKKYSLLDLSASDFNICRDGTEGTKNDESSAITKQQRQWYHVQSHKRGPTLRPHYVLNRKGLEQEMQQWHYPLHFLDFETISPVIPHYCNMAPYEVCAFQFSQHIVSQKDEGAFEVRHASEFLHTEEGDPSVAFLKALHNAVGDPVSTEGGTVFQWSPYENTVLRTMLSSPEISSELSPCEVSSLSALLSTGTHPMVDLCKIAHDYYYVDGSEGSSSIKHLLQPTLQASDHLKAVYGTPTYNGRNFRDFQWYQLDDETGRARCPYDILSGENSAENSADITQGGAAAAAFSELQNTVDLDQQNREAITNSLLRYCELDTLAMVMMFQAWQGFLNEKRHRKKA